MASVGEAPSAGTGGCEVIFGMCLPPQVKLADLYCGVGLVALTNLLRFFGAGTVTTNLIVPVDQSLRILAMGTLASILGRLIVYYVHNITLFSYQSK